MCPPNSNLMKFRQIQTLLQRSKTTNHLLQLQSLILKTSLDHHPDIATQLITSSIPISIDFTTLIFYNLPTDPPLFAWNSLIRFYTKSSTPIDSLKLFTRMQKLGLKPDNFTYPFVFKACGRCSMLREALSVLSIVWKIGLDCDKYVGNTLIKMFAVCGKIASARTVFDGMTVRDVVSWSSMIAAYVASNLPFEAFDIFRYMKSANEKPNSVTLVSLISACVRLLDLNTGKSIHSYIILNQLEMDVSLGTAILEMYSKCGHIKDAVNVFCSMREKNLQTWTVMISGLANNGRGNDAISLFIEMEQTRLKPDSKSFSSILSACGHSGLVHEGQNFFNKMVRVYKIEATIEHYGCMVDLYGRAGLIEDAHGIIKKMPMEPNTVVLRSFLGACRSHGRIICLDDSLRKILLRLEPELGANYVIAATVSSLSGSFDEAADLRVVMKHKGLKKVPGCSWVE